MSKNDENIIATFSTEDGYDIEIELAELDKGYFHIHVNYMGGTVTLLTSFTKDEAQELINGLTKAVDLLD